jgi:hypothetical protein
LFFLPQLNKLYGTLPTFPNSMQSCSVYTFVIKIVFRYVLAMFTSLLSCSGAGDGGGNCFINNQCPNCDAAIGFGCNTRAACSVCSFCSPKHVNNHFLSYWYTATDSSVSNELKIKSSSLTFFVTDQHRNQRCHQLRHQHPLQRLRQQHLQLPIRSLHCCVLLFLQLKMFLFYRFRMSPQTQSPPSTSRYLVVAGLYSLY